MQALAPAEPTRKRMERAVGLSLLLPGAGHLQAGRFGWALFWAILCQGLLFGGLSLAGNSQFDYGKLIHLGGRPILMLLIPEMGNFLGVQFAAVLAKMHSVEAGGHLPEHLPWRNLGYLMSGASGVLSAFAAAHASSLCLVRDEPLAQRRVSPGGAALATLLLPGLGHWLSGRRFKTWLFGGTIVGLFALGMTLGDFADFDRQRHPYYWAGQMLLGPVGWITAFLCEPQRFPSVLPYQDAGLLFTTAAGFFTVIAALDSYHRAEDDWLAAARGVPGRAAAGAA
ncbi:MAG: hypothetical protein EYC70_16375 [Planctomycetota bacterium]|nr:MAG: hypothetical protein EYC70_16375 [Planctomycetota bacterium]